jgi:hypothetical protein
MQMVFYAATRSPLNPVASHIEPGNEIAGRSGMASAD